MRIFPLNEWTQVTMFVEGISDPSAGIFPSLTQVDLRIEDPDFFDHVEPERFHEAFKAFLAQWFDVPSARSIYEKTELARLSCRD
jgi:hypothetical protein